MIRVVIVDDEILARVGIQSLLENQENIVVVGSFGVAEDTLRFLEMNLVDIVITDIEMPNMNGLEFVQRIREKKLAAGIIILSCYDKFEYAKEAISLGVDGYILKQDINKESIEKVVRDVAEKTKGSRNPEKTESLEQIFDDNEEIKVVAVVRMDQEERETEEQELSREKMMIRLLEELVSHYHMGNLFSSYKRSPFIVFEFPCGKESAERHKMLEDYIEIIDRNFFQYTNRRILLGISGEFVQTQEMMQRYGEARDVLERRFFEAERRVFYSGEIPWQEEASPLIFSERTFMEEGGVEIFARELSGYLRICREQWVRIKNMKDIVAQSVSILMFNILKESVQKEDDIGIWQSRYPMAGLIFGAVTANELKLRVLEMMERFRGELETYLKEDSFGEVFRYIEQHIRTQLSLEELAELTNMSVSAFSKRFKERCCMSPIQYINQRKIEKVKDYLKQSEYTLGEIAELTGFSNENYMVRVFKKITGNTITDYRRRAKK